MTTLTTAQIARIAQFDELVYALTTDGRIYVRSSGDRGTWSEYQALPDAVDIAVSREYVYAIAGGDAWRSLVGARSGWDSLGETGVSAITVPEYPLDSLIVSVGDRIRTVGPYDWNGTDQVAGTDGWVRRGWVSSNWVRVA